MEIYMMKIKTIYESHGGLVKAQETKEFLSKKVN